MALQSKSIMCLRLVDRLIDIASLSSSASESSSVPSPVIGNIGWKGYICDIGSKNYGKLITVIRDYSDVNTPKREVMDCNDTTIEHTTKEETYLRLLTENFVEVECLSKGDYITVYDPGSIHDGRYGTLSHVYPNGSGSVDIVGWGDNVWYNGLSKNFIKVDRQP
jgi:hypothetical protein